MEATKVKAVMEQLDKSYGNGYWSKNNIYHFAQLYGSDYKELTNHRTKPKTQIILLSEEEKGRKIKEVKTRVTKKKKRQIKEDNGKGVWPL